MKLGPKLLSAALIVYSSISFAGTSSAINFVLERKLGQGGSLGKETLILDCPAQSTRVCTITKVADGATLSDKMPYKEASRIMRDFFKIEEKRPSKEAVLTQSQISPMIYWGATFRGKEFKGAIEIAQDRFDLAVLSAEQQIVRGFKP